MKVAPKHKRRFISAMIALMAGIAVMLIIFVFLSDFPGEWSLDVNAESGLGS